MSTDTTLAFHLPDGWTLRRVATAMVQEWLPPFRAEPAMKAARWVVQSVMEAADQGAAPLWEPGISTSEYETRLDAAVKSWVIRATAGRGKGTILARVSIDEDRPDLLQLSPGTAFPESLFDAEKVDEVTGGAGLDGLFAALLTQHGFRPAN